MKNDLFDRLKKATNEETEPAPAEKKEGQPTQEAAEVAERKKVYEFLKAKKEPLSEKEQAFVAEYEKANQEQK